jgi:shikimate kinase
MTNITNIIMIGITGVGKTTIGKTLAETLQTEFIDLDKNIEQHCGVDIATIFAIEGEGGFRERETDELRRTLKIEGGFVLSVGGGCILRKENRQLISAGNNVVVQLYANIDILVERLSKSSTKRPLLQNDDMSVKITELYNSRKEYYDRITDFKINTSNMKPIQVVEEIIAHLNKK